MSAGGWIALVVAFLIYAVWQIMKDSAAKTRAKAGLPPKPPREPMTDFSPYWTGGQAYRAAVRAVTPGGITVRQSRCCQRGHQTPGQAVTHAGAIARRIELTGR